MRLKLRGPIGNGKLLAMKKTSKGRQPQSIESEESLQPLIGSSPPLKLKPWRPNQN